MAARMTEMGSLLGKRSRMPDAEYDPDAPSTSARPPPKKDKIRSGTVHSGYFPGMAPPPLEDVQEAMKKWAIETRQAASTPASSPVEGPVPPTGASFDSPQLAPLEHSFPLPSTFPPANNSPSMAMDPLSDIGGQHEMAPGEAGHPALENISAPQQVQEEANQVTNQDPIGPAGNQIETDRQKPALWVGADPGAFHPRVLRKEEMFPPSFFRSRSIYSGPYAIPINMTVEEAIGAYEFKLQTIRYLLSEYLNWSAPMAKLKQNYAEILDLCGALGFHDVPAQVYHNLPFSLPSASSASSGESHTEEIWVDDSDDSDNDTN